MLIIAFSIIGLFPPGPHWYVCSKPHHVIFSATSYCKHDLFSSRSYVKLQKAGDFTKKLFQLSVAINQDCFFFFLLPTHISCRPEVKKAMYPPIARLILAELWKLTYFICNIDKVSLHYALKCNKSLALHGDLLDTVILF